MTIADIEARIREAVAAMRAAGVQIVCGSWGITGHITSNDGAGHWSFFSSTTPRCCPLGAVVKAREQGHLTCVEPNVEAAAILGVQCDWVRAFTLGFDGVEFRLPGEDEQPTAAYELEAYALGASMRREMKPAETAVAAETPF
jgi:hypothetical protein